MSFAEVTYARTRVLVERGDYLTISAVVSREQALLEAEVRRRLALPGL